MEGRVSGGAGKWWYEQGEVLARRHEGEEGVRPGREVWAKGGQREVRASRSYD